MKNPLHSAEQSYIFYHLATGKSTVNPAPSSKEVDPEVAGTSANYPLTTCFAFYFVGFARSGLIDKKPVSRGFTTNGTYWIPAFAGMTKKLVPGILSSSNFAHSTEMP